MKKTINSCVGELVEVRSKAEILATLDKQGRLDGLPFMPEMFEFCGRRFRVFKRAHKTCDTVNKTGNRRMANAVHLEEIRCSGAAHGGCQAGCLIFWKEAWLKQVTDQRTSRERVAAFSDAELASGSAATTRCTEEDVWRSSTVPAQAEITDGPTYVCQATQLPLATERLPWWQLRQYIEDYRSGNVDLRSLCARILYRWYDNLVNLGIGIGPVLRWLYDRFQIVRGGRPYPARPGKIPQGSPTPSCTLNLQPGELVRIKSQDDILGTVDRSCRNRGLTFDPEMAPYCGRTYRVLKRVNKIINEQTGRMITLKNECLMLEAVYCEGRYSKNRLFCPRAIYTYWREIWLERADARTHGPLDNVPGETKDRV